MVVALLAAGSLIAAMPAHASAVDAANEVRRAGCAGRPGVTAKLRQTSRIDTVARRWADGGSFTTAVNASGVRLKASVGLRVSADSSDAVIRALLAERNCRELTSGEFREVGATRRDGQVWIVIASPYQPPAPAAAGNVSAQVLALTNAARSKPRRCGSQSFAAAPPLTGSRRLDDIALAHSRDMAKGGFLEHKGSDGSMAGQRATRSGYVWRAVAENVAGGPQTAREVVDGWIASPGHCANIMSPDVTEMGVAYATNERARLVIYWTQLFARPR